MDLPSGTVTFLLTDIEGSTQLWETHPYAMRRALERHDAVLHRAVKANSGVVIKSRGEGDSFFCVFARAHHAVGAALAAQVALTHEAWPQNVVLRVRMAIHTGDAELRNGDYFGPTINRCARLRAVCHGGQVVLTMASAELARDNLPLDAILRDLGEHFLRDISRPETVHQLVHAELPADFPHLRSAKTKRHNLPLELTSFVGRSSELESVKNLLAESRLVTVTGTGGAGKTRLALKVAADLASGFEGGVWFVDLSSIQDPEQISRAVAGALGLRDEPGKTAWESLSDRLEVSGTLIVLDNCEHLVQATSRLASQWLQASSTLRILATSREPLDVPGESLFRIQSLRDDEAARLFIERADIGRSMRAATDTDLVAQICTRLDGLPLAIELTAARARSIPLRRILERIDSRMPLSHGGSGGFAARQQTLDAMVEWSHHLLDETEQALFRRLAVFAGGFQLESAESVAVDEVLPMIEIAEVLGKLAEKSLVMIGDSADGRFRYSMLQTIRQYALKRLEASGEEAEVRHRHVTYLLGLAEEAATNLKRSGQSGWLARIAEEQDDLRAAARWSLEHDHDLYRRLVAQLASFWSMVGPVDEIKEWLGQAIELKKLALDATQARLLDGRGLTAERIGNYEEALADDQAALSIWESLGEKGRMASCVNRMGVVAGQQGDNQTARAHFARAREMAADAADTRIYANATANLGVSLAEDPETTERARELHEEALALFAGMGDQWTVATQHNNLGDLAMASTNLVDAARHYRTSIELLREIGVRSDVLANDIDGCAGVAAASGQHERAFRLAGAASALLKELGFASTPFQLRMVEKWLAPSREALGPDEAAKAWSEGEAMGFESLIQYVMADS